MVFFIYGEEEFSSRRKLNEIIGKYKAANPSGMNFRRFDFNGCGFRDFLASIETVSMFPEKKLAVLENVFQNKEAEAAFAVFLSRNDLSENKEIFLVFYQGGGKSNPSVSEAGKSDLFPLLKKKAVCQEFPRLEGAALARWISKEAADKGAEPERGAASLFSFHFGNDLRKISNELEKLACYDKKITKENFYLLSPVFAQSDSFQFVDALLKGDKTRSLFLLDRCLESGIKETMLIGAVASNFRSALKIKSLLAKEKSSDVLAKKAGIHPFVVKKLTPFAKAVSEEAMKKIHSRVLRADFEIKRGKAEPKAALNLLVFDIVSLLSKK